MPATDKKKSKGATPRKLFIVFFAITVPLLLFLEQRLLSRPDENEIQFLEDQRSVMRPDVEWDRELMESAPRYKIEADIDVTASRYQGEVEIHYSHDGENCLPEVGLLLYANAASMYGGSLEVDQVSIDGETVSFQQVDDAALNVPLEECLAAGSSLTLQADFAGSVPATGDAGYGILSANERGLALSGWYPMLSFPVAGVEDVEIPTVGDALHTEISLVEAFITAPAGFEIVSTGEATTESTEDRVQWRVISGPARELTVLLLDDPQPITRQIDEVELRFFPSAASSELDGQAPIEMAADIFELFQDQFEPYPYRQLEIVEWPVTIGGYEFSGLVLIDQDLRASGNETDFEFLLAHELAHQWWYLLIGNDQIREPWLDEALANYSVVRYLETKDGEQGEALLSSWRQQCGLRQANDPPVDSPATDFSGWDGYRRTVYIHGALFLDALEEEIGRAAFDEIISQYLREHRYQIATTESFVRLVQSTDGDEIVPLLEQWLSTENASQTTDP